MILGVGIIGAGIWGEIHAKVYSSDPRVRLIGVCDKDVERAKKMAKKYGAQKWYSDYEDLLEDSEIAAVSVATPDFTHRDPVIKALQNGKHVIVEKPMATSIEDAREMVKISQERKRILMVDFHNRWNPPFAHAYNSIKNGEIGTPLYIYMRHSNSLYVPLEMLSWSGKSSSVWFLGSHSVDLVRWLIGNEIEKIYSISKKDILNSLGISTPDFFISTLEFKNGSVAVIENFWILPKKMPTLGDFKCEIIGSKGMFNIDFTHNRCIEKYTQEGLSYPDILVCPEIHGKPTGFAFESIRHFLDCICENQSPMITPEDGFMVTKIICGIYQSVETGKVIYLD